MRVRRAARVDALPNGQATLHFAGHPETLTPTTDGEYAAGPLRLKPDGTRLRMIRGTDNIDTLLEPITGTAPMNVAGIYRSAEYGAAITIATTGGTLYAACSGELGDGAMVPLIPYGADTWLMPCPRSLDFSAPGDWTLSFRRDAAGITGLRMGCWLARRIEYARV